MEPEEGHEETVGLIQLVYYILTKEKARTNVAFGFNKVMGTEETNVIV